MNINIKILRELIRSIIFPKSKHIALFLVVITVAIFWMLISGGYPQPYCDDMFVAGAAINMARGGGFENPYVRDWLAAFPAKKPFFFPPGYSYMLAGWLKLFGISISTVLAFQWCLLITGACSLIFILRRCFAQDISISIVSGLAFLLAFQLDGFRNEVAAYALSFLGLCICFRENRILKFLGYFLIVFSGVVYPTAPIISIGGFKRLAQSGGAQ